MSPTLKHRVQQDQDYGLDLPMMEHVNLHVIRISLGADWLAVYQRPHWQEVGASCSEFISSHEQHQISTAREPLDFDKLLERAKRGGYSYAALRRQQFEKVLPAAVAPELAVVGSLEGAADGAELVYVAFWLTSTYRLCFDNSLAARQLHELLDSSERLDVGRLLEPDLSIDRVELSELPTTSHGILRLKRPREAIVGLTASGTRCMWVEQLSPAFISVGIDEEAASRDLGGLVSDQIEAFRYQLPVAGELELLTWHAFEQFFVFDHAVLELVQRCLRLRQPDVARKLYGSDVSPRLGKVYEITRPAVSR